MKFDHSLLASAWLAVALCAPAMAADKIKIGFLSTVSGGPTVGLAKEKRAGFDLALKQLGGKLGGLPVEVVNGDDQNNPDVAKQAFDRLAKRDKVDVVTGIINTAVIHAIAPLAAQHQIFFMNSNVGQRDFIADKCGPYYFNTGWHIESLNEAMGKYLVSQGKKRVFVAGGAWPAGREHIDAFKRAYAEPVAGEVYFKMQTLDFSAELAQIRAANPDAVYVFAFGPLSVNFMKQYQQAGLGNIPLYGPSPLADEDTIPAAGQAAVGVISSGHWNFDLTHDVNKKFVAAYQDEYKRSPSLYSEQGYTTALVLDAAIKAVSGRIEDKAAFRKAIENVSLEAPRGPFKFNVDHSPVQNVYLRKVGKTDKGEPINHFQRMIAANHAVRGADQCKL